jgi:hypothetical protein
VTPAFAALSSKPYLHHPAGYAPMAAGFARLKVSSSSRNSVAEERKEEDFFSQGRGVGSAGAGDVGGAEARMRLLVSGRGKAEGVRFGDGEKMMREEGEQEEGQGFRLGVGGRGLFTEERRTRRDFVPRGGVRR